MKLQFKEIIKIYKDSTDRYHTNTGCDITILKEDGLSKLHIKCDRPITYDEIKTIRYSLLNRSRTYYFNIDNYGNETTLIQEKSKPLYESQGSKILVSGGIESTYTGETYVILITLDGGTQMHLSIARGSEEYVSLSEMQYLRNEHLPMDKQFGMYLPPEEEFVNVHSNCFHLLEII